jgi:outer membrane protein TolC
MKPAIVSTATLRTVLLAALLTTAHGTSALGTEPPGFEFLKRQFDELTQNQRSRNSPLAQIDVSEAQVGIARSAHLPTLSLNGSTGLQQTWNYESGTQTNSDDTHTKTLSAGVEVAQRLWSGGADSLAVSAAEQRLKGQQTDERLTRHELQTALTRDLVKILNTARTTRQKGKELEQWRILNEITHRKAKAGHLSQRDTLQSDKEFANAGMEFATAQRGLARELALAMQRYDLRRSSFQVAELPTLETAFAPLLDRGEKMTQSQTLAEEVARGSLELQKIQFQKQGIEDDAEQRRIQLLNPTLSAVAAASGNYIDNVNRAVTPIRGVTPAQPDWSVTGSVGLKFSLSPFNPRAFAATSEIEAQRRVLATQEAATLRNIELQCATWAGDAAELRTRLEQQRRLLATVRALTDGNQQLYDAGLIDTFQLIRGLQDLYTQERAIIELENQNRITALNTIMAQHFGITKTGTP